MSVTRGLAGVLVVLAGVAVVAASAAAPDRKAKPPRIVAAVMQDADRDSRADSVRLTYSIPIRHAADRDGRYPFAVAGYRIRSVGAASGRALVILLVEKALPDPAARPAIRYRRTGSKPVSDGAGMQAVAQLFQGARAHRRTAQPTTTTTATTPTGTTTTTTTPTTTTTTTTTAVDADRDGYPDARDCGPKDATVHPGAPDLPDFSFTDSNCDGIDGTEEDAVFASQKGDDANPGTKEKPKRQINAATSVAQAGGKYVLAAAGSYSRTSAVSGVSVYGGYDPDDWSRKTGLTTQIVGSSHGFFAGGATDVTLQLLSIRADNEGGSVYGIRAINGSSLRLQRVTVLAGDGAPGVAGANGAAGRPGNAGYPGLKGACDTKIRAFGGAGGTSPVGRDGGKGGEGKYESRGGDGAPGIVGTPGGKGGASTSGHTVVTVEGDQNGKNGENGSTGAAGSVGPGGTNSAALASAVWQGRGGIDGIYGAPGNGGGGGGAGGGQVGAFVINGTGNGGGGGGGGGEGGRGGAGGLPGGGSFGVYLVNSSLAVEKSSIRAGNGGAGGRGGNGGTGGTGGKGGEGPSYCLQEIGPGGDGGRGGNGGQGGGGGGGAGGPSIGIFKAGTSTAKIDGTTIAAGTAGPGGATGAGGTPAATAEAGIAQAIYP